MFARLRRRFMREMPKAGECSINANELRPGENVKYTTEAPTIIAHQPKTAPIVIQHTHERMTPFVINGQVWGWAYRNDPVLILRTLQAPADQVLH